MQTNKSAPAVNVAAGAPVPRQVAKAPTKPSAAVTAQVDKDQQAFGSLAFEAERDKVAAEEAAKKKAATEKRLLRHRAARCTTAQSIFNTEVGKIMAKEFNAVDFRGQSWADEVELSEEDVTLPVRDVFGARREEAVKECTIPPYDVRLEIWEKFVHLEFSDCFPGPFEIAIPPWFDFHDLVLDGLDKIKENGLIDQDLVLLWSTQSGRPVRLVVGPDPSLFFDDETRDKEKVNRTRGVRVRTLWHQIAEWLCTVYRGNPICLADFLQARNDLVLQCGSHMLECSDYVFKLQEKWDHIKLDPLQSLHGAEYERENWDMWMPEIYAYISRPNGPNPAMLEEWVLRAGGLFEERLTIATAIWSTFDAMRAIDWWNQVMSTYSTEIVPSS
ncbi:hypothetical protein FPOAC1_008660 [Fusarium poae]|uniref:hypothetical protein n=1 Tax=Fusarium poae TaxID=36050 RepID=UPI001CE8B0DE|nr:hypothetical protein FPOAC1_008660 [Fusarium poae]KAG8669271.1 hypothetical protein FPOAC1_008660 [Fusarium poae]